MKFVWQWPSAKLKGDSQVIPRVCPNCLKPTELYYRYGYTGPFYLLSRTTYYQTFYYCKPCGQAMEKKWKQDKWTFWVKLLLSFASFFAPIALMVNMPKQTGSGVDIMTVLFITAMIGTPFLVFFGLGWIFNSSYNRKNPIRPDQVTNGPAAYYAGKAILGMFGPNIYSALRPEWLQELVKLNPGQVDSTAYKNMTGQDKPASGTQKPFA
jgi:hypothetical protein